MIVDLQTSTQQAREARKGLASEVEQYRNLMHFVHVGRYTVAWKRTLESGGRVLRITTAVCNEDDESDSLLGMQQAGRRMLDGAYVLLWLPAGRRNVRRWLRKMFDTV